LTSVSINQDKLTGPQAQSLEREKKEVKKEEKGDFGKKNQRIFTFFVQVFLFS